VHEVSARALLAVIAATAAALLAVTFLATDDDPCAGHVTPDGITADAIVADPCNEMPGVP